MKAKLNLTIDKDLIPLCKNYAHMHRKSLSQFIEDLLREVIKDKDTTFSKKWRGKFKASEKCDIRYDKLKERYLQ